MTARAGAFEIPFRLIAEPYFCALDPTDNTRSDIHFRPEDVFPDHIDRTDVNPGAHPARLECRMPRVEIQRMGIVERSPNRAEHRRHAVADRLDFAPRVLGEQCPAVAEMGTPHTVHLLVPECSAKNACETRRKRVSRSETGWNRTVPARRALSLSYGDGELESRSLHRRFACELDLPRKLR